MRETRRLAALVALAAVFGCGPATIAPKPTPSPATARDPIRGIDEASGVTRVGNTLFVVGDHEPGTFYRLDLRPEDIPPSGEPGTIALAPDRLNRIRWPDAASMEDLEAVDHLADGRMVLLSEERATVFAQAGPVMAYGTSMQSIAGRGLEGMTVRALPGGVSRIAVLWEGGYPEDARPRSAFPPALLVYDLPGGAAGRALTPAEAMLRVELEVPLPPGDEPHAQRFRAPDLVWYRFPDTDVWGFLVLLSSGWGQRPEPGSAAECDESVDLLPRRYCHKWIQRFTAEGQPFGEPWDIEPGLPDGVRLSNVEGMGWFDSGERVVLVYDEKVARRAVDPQLAIVLPLPEGW